MRTKTHNKQFQSMLWTKIESSSQSKLNSLTLQIMLIEEASIDATSLHEESNEDDDDEEEEEESG